MEMKKDLSMAYNARQKKSTKRGGVGCMDCMAEGGKCMAHGGAVENEKMHPEHEEEMPAGMMRDIENDSMEDEFQSSRPGILHEDEDMARDKGMDKPMQKYAHGGTIVDEILAGRKKMAKGGAVEEDADAMPDYDTRVDLEPVHTMSDSEHDTESGSLDDESLVGQIMKDRKKKRFE